MERNLTIYFTSDVHGYFSPVDYATGAPAATGLANCIQNFTQDGNTLILDGGDTLQGSPFTYFFHKHGVKRACIPAQMMNLGGYQFITLGNHDFNYGRETLEQYLETLNAVCLCANVEGLVGVQKTALVTLENGLRVGLTGITTPFINTWEKPEHLKGITIHKPIPAAAQALKELRKAGADLTVCLYHGGFENDLDTGARLSETEENQGWRICHELDFDILLTGHQHTALENQKVANTFTCQPPDKARGYIRMDVTVDSASGRVAAESHLYPAGAVTHPAAMTLLGSYDREVAAWLDTPMGHLDVPLRPGLPIEMASHGSYIANFFNQVQLAASGADISATCLGNEVRGFEQDVTIRDVVATYIYPNTLKTLRVNRAVLRHALERSAEYFALDEGGRLCVSDSFLKPKVEHYNFDYFAGIQATIDVRRPVGQRVLSIEYKGVELPEEQALTLCMNNYRATGTGGYPCYASCEIVREQEEEIAEMIMDYVVAHQSIIIDKTPWLTVLY